MAVNKQWMNETITSAYDGVNRGRDAELLGEHQLAAGQNVSLRGGRPHSRPRFVKRAVVPTGKMQGLAIFKAINRVIVSVSGRVYEFDPVRWTCIEKTSDTDRNSANRQRHTYCETVESLIIQDFQSKPIVYDGADFRRAADDEVPVGGAMAYGNGRLAVAVNNGRDVRLGDIRQKGHQSELKFTETHGLLGGGDFSFPSEITALAVLPVVDTGSGQGSLIVGCSDKVFSLKTQITQREIWDQVGMESILLPNRGISGPNAVAAVNQDLYFRSSDGLRSVRTSVTTDYSTPGQTPLSAEVRHRFDYDTPFLLDDASVVLFDNRLLCTHSPFNYSNRALNTGLVSLNFDGLSAVGTKSPAVFEGEWDGLVIAQLATGTINGVERCLVLGRDTDGTNGLWEILREVEETPSTSDSPVQAIESRTFVGDTQGALKSLRRADLVFSGIRGVLNVRLYFRTAKSPFWIRWDQFSATALQTAPTWGRVTAQKRSPFMSHEPPDAQDPQTGRPVYVGNGFQLRVEWEGSATLDFSQVFMEQIVEPGFATNLMVEPPVASFEVPAYAYDPAFWYHHNVSPLSGIADPDTTP